MDDTPSRLRRALTWLEATPAEAAGLLVLLLGSVVATGLLVWQATERPASGAEPPVVTAPVGPETAPGRDAGVATSPEDEDASGGGHGEVAQGPIVVHVTGAVLRPGVVTLAGGDRVTDAVAAAGGATDDARLDLVNLARTLQDGEHVHLPREGEEPPVPTGGASGEGTDPAGRVDLNHATVEQLQTLPGIGPAKAAEIVRHREEQGPFAVPGDLRDVAGIGEATFQRLADLVTVS